MLAEMVQVSINQEVLAQRFFPKVSTMESGLVNEVAGQRELCKHFSYL